MLGCELSVVWGRYGGLWVEREKGREWRLMVGGKGEKERGGRSYIYFY